ncbi:MAG: CPBP family intramembrane glutamic endopeptidase [Mariniblastus sp.]
MDFDTKNAKRRQRERANSGVRGSRRASPSSPSSDSAIPDGFADRKPAQSDWPTGKLTNESQNSTKRKTDGETASLNIKGVPCQTQAIGALLSSKTRSKVKQNQKLGSYSHESRRPLVCLLFVLPLIVFYEIGSIMLGRQSLRSGIDQWFHEMLSQLGFGQLVLLPILTIGVMIGWHHQIKDHWKVSIRCFFGMVLEAIGLGLILFWAASVTDLLHHESANIGVRFGSEFSSDSNLLSMIVAYVGSGIYEELFFRILLLIPIIHGIGKLMEGNGRNSRRSKQQTVLNSNQKVATFIGVVLVSLLFAAAHYNIFNPAGNQFELSSFVFRFSASIVFCILFLFRGFGIAVGTHVAYDVLMQL